MKHLAFQFLPKITGTLFQLGGFVIVFHDGNNINCLIITMGNVLCAKLYEYAFKYLPNIYIMCNPEDQQWLERLENHNFIRTLVEIEMGGKDKRRGVLREAGNDGGGEEGGKTKRAMHTHQNISHTL